MQTIQSTSSRLPVPKSVVLVSPDASFRRCLAETLQGMRWRVQEAAGGAEALCCLQDRACEAMLMDSWLPDLEAGDFASQLRLQYPNLDLIRVDEMPEAADGARSSRRNELLHALRRVGKSTDSVPAPAENAAMDVSTAGNPRRVAAIAPRGLPSPFRRGMDPAVAFFSRAARAETPRKPAATIPNASPAAHQPRPEIATALPAELSAMAPGGLPGAPVGLPGMIGGGATMQELAHRIHLVAARKTTVLIEGPTGSGKELVAQALHVLSDRAAKPFIVINCAAIPEMLLEAELFGHTRGAFTGAVQSRTGRIEAARGGTLFLDEIGELPLALQSKLLRFLESGELQRIGENELIHVDVRVVAATHQPLMERVSAGTFRSDLYFRLAVFPLRTPALVERLEDIPALTAHFLKRLGEIEPAKSMEPEAIRKLASHCWPGNVRELAHVIERAYILAGSEPRITAAEICFA